MLENHVAAFVDFIRAERYAAPTIHKARMVASEWAIYLKGRVDRPEEITSDHFNAYLDIRSKIFAELWKRPFDPRYRTYFEYVLKLFLRYLAKVGIQTAIPLPGNQDSRFVAGYESLLDAYERFLVDHRGLRPTTVRYYLDRAAGFCRTLVERGSPAWDDLTPELIYDHLRSQAAGCGHLSFQVNQTTLRSFFRFLNVAGHLKKRLDQYLVSFRAYRLARVPKTVALEDLYRLFDDMKGNRPIDIKDRAVLLLLTLYGLRVGELAQLRLEEVHWRDQTVVIQHRKAGKDLILPLHPAVLRALGEYVDRVRPRNLPYREFFITLRRPHPFPEGSHLFDTIKHRILRLGLRFRAHALRHTLATRLINNDCPPEWIQVLLGHVRFDSTRVYSKVDLAHLREVADNDAAAL
jgi:integrase/recombinase XerD